MKHWFTSDTHFKHNNIIEYCKRPFKDTNHMNEAMIRNWNERVKPNDQVFFLGDFCLGNPNELLERLSGNKVFIQGNHDYGKSLNPRIKNIVVEVGRKEAYLVHNPLDANPEAEINLVGHVHEKWKVKRLSPESVMINVGVDVWNYRPISTQEILKEYDNFIKQECLSCGMKFCHGCLNLKNRPSWKEFEENEETNTKQT